MSVYAILLCAGEGTRMGAKASKTLLSIGGVSAAARCEKTLTRACDGVVIVAREGDLRAFEEAFPGRTIVAGGADRQASVYNGLLALPEDCDIVLVHDGARPLVCEALARRVIESVRARGSGVAAIPARDTLRRADADGRLIATVPRESVWRMQTPQGFRKHDLLAAHELAKERATDDAELLLAQGKDVYLVMGNASNIKLTAPEDAQIARALAGETRVGHGFDAHRLVENRALVLCGVTIPYHKGLLGHSDADVALHALSDALLGALAEGDIGKHFPDSDARYKGISSMILLEHVAELARARGFTAGNADVTIVAQAPKLASAIPQMRANVAKALGISQDRVSVKATTTEGMGFEGRGEGISAHAVVLLQS